MKRAHAVVAVVVLAVGSAGIVGIRWLDRRDESTRPATVQAVAAAAIRHVPGEANLVKVMDGGGKERLYARLTYEVGGRSVLLGIEVHRPTGWPADTMGDCEHLSLGEASCETREIEGGGKLTVARPPDMDGTMVAVTRADVFLLVSASPRGASDPPISADVLTAIATDPLIGLETSPQMLEAGKNIQLTG